MCGVGVGGGVVVSVVVSATVVGVASGVVVVGAVDGVVGGVGDQVSVLVIGCWCHYEVFCCYMLLLRLKTVLVPVGH